jgi:uncharacterized protein
MNIQMFSMVSAAYFNPTAYGDLEGANFWVWLFSHLFADLKFMAIFSMLFGAGLILMWQRAEASGRSFFTIHCRRMFWLLLIGLLHAHLLWFGDILVPYAICGMLICWFRKMKPTTLLLVGFLILLVGSSLFLLSGLSMPYWPQEDLEKFTQESWRPSPDRIRDELQIYRGGWREQMEDRVVTAIELETFVFLYFFLWRAGGLMLIGMALFKLGVLSAQRSVSFYWTLVVLGALVGVPLIGYGAVQNIEAGWPPSSFFLGTQFNYWGSILVSLGWISIVILVYQKGWFRFLARRLSAVGRMALSNYLLESIICTTVFYGHGLGLFGRLNRLEQFFLVLAVWIVLLILSPWWLNRFRYGPFEWTWRSLTYWSVLPFRR